MNFIAQVQQVNVKNCKDLAKVTRVIFETDELISGELEKFAADQLVKVTVEEYGNNEAKKSG